MNNMNQKTVNFAELFSSQPCFIKSSYCDDEVKYCDFSADLDIIEKSVTLLAKQQYTWESSENYLIGWLFQIEDLIQTYFILFTDENSSTNGGIVSDGMCVATVEGHGYQIGQEIPIESIGSIVKIYCGHPSVVSRSHEYWCYSQGECGEPQQPDPESQNLLDQLLDACDQLETQVNQMMGSCKDSSSESDEE